MQTTEDTKRPRIAYKLLLSALSFLFFLVAADMLLSVYQFIVKKIYEERPSNIAATPIHEICKEPPFYRLNPENPYVKTIGLYNPEYLCARTDNRCRMLFLGDSVIYGSETSPSNTFPKEAEAIINKSGNIIDIINSGTKGYTTYNELYFYRRYGREMQPDVVVLCVCLNDVVNPRLHWNYTKNVITNLPPESIPNKAYDEEVVLRFMNGRESISAIKRSIITRWFHRNYLKNEYKVIDGNKWHVCLASGDWTSIDVLDSFNTPEWKWLDKMFTELIDTLNKDNVKLAVIIEPLSYQMAKGYPVKPQKLFMEYFREKNIPCLDLLPCFEAYREDQIFRGHGDIWHFTEFGHNIAAEATAAFIKENRLLEYRRKPPASN